VFVIEVVEGELLEEIEAAAKGAGITDAAVVSLIGAVDDFTISSMPLNDATRDQPLNYAMPAEITGTGEIVSGKAHIHVVMVPPPEFPVTSACFGSTSGRVSK